MSIDGGKQPPGIVVGRLSPDDWRIERDLRLAALSESPFAFGSRLADAVLMTEADWKARLLGQARFAAWRDGVALGTAGFAVGFDPFPANAALVVGVWVAPGGRGSGVGDALLETLVAAVPRETNLRRILLCVLVQNAPAIRLYGRHGFRPVTLPFAPDDGEIHMELILTQFQTEVVPS